MEEIRKIRINQMHIKKSGASGDLDDLVFEYDPQYEGNIRLFSNYDSGQSDHYNDPVSIISYNGNGWCDVVRIN